MTSLTRARSSGRTAIRPLLSRGENLITVLGATWLVVGLFLDGWAHNTQKPESFLTPWHAVLYSGFLVTAAWICWQVRRGHNAGARGAAAVPVGYGFGLAGAALFALGGVFDTAWHEIFGIEVDIEALLSPSHLLLFAGALLVLTSPLRAGWSDQASSSPTLREFLPALLSITLSTALVAFFFMYLSPFTHAPVSSGPYRFIGGIADRDLAGWLAENVRKDGIASILLTTIILVAPALLLLRRWTTPKGTFTLMFSGVAVALTALEGFALAWTALAAVMAGVVADVLVHRLEPSLSRPWAYRAFASAVPAVLWLAYFGIIQLRFGVGWSVELWAGVTTMAVLTGFGLSVLMLPPAIPPGRTPATRERT